MPNRASSLAWHLNSSLNISFLRIHIYIQDHIPIKGNTPLCYLIPTHTHTYASRTMYLKKTTSLPAYFNGPRVEHRSNNWLLSANTSSRCKLKAKLESCPKTEHGSDKGTGMSENPTSLAEKTFPCTALPAHICLLCLPFPRQFELCLVTIPRDSIFLSDKI